jgi:uncharacterized protein (DUF2062 family)
MLFARRRPLSLKERLIDLVWPRIGVRRTLRYYWHRLQRLPGTPASIAAGFGWGLGVSVNPVVGTHIILGATGAWLTRSNILAAAIATFLVNPWTAPPIWFATYYAGRFMQGHTPGGRAPGFVAMFEGLAQAAWSLDFNLFVERVWPVLQPMLLGSIPVGIIFGLASYGLLRPVLERLHEARAHRLKERHAKAHPEDTVQRP